MLRGKDRHTGAREKREERGKERKRERVLVYTEYPIF